jgi:hypothetical protein
MLSKKTDSKVRGSGGVVTRASKRARSTVPTTAEISSDAAVVELSLSTQIVDKKYDLLGKSGTKDSDKHANASSDDDAMETLSTASSAAADTVYAEPCTCGTCFRLTACAGEASDLEWVFHQHNPPLNHGNSVRLLRAYHRSTPSKVHNCALSASFAPKLYVPISYVLEFHSGNLRAHLSLSSGEADVEDDLPRLCKFMPRSAVEHVVRMQQFVALCARIKLPGSRKIQSDLAFYADDLDRVYCLPVEKNRHGKMERGVFVIDPNQPVLAQCAAEIVHSYFGEATMRQFLQQIEISDKNKFECSIFPAYDRFGERTDVMLLDFLRTLCLHDYSDASELHLHPYFCTAHRIQKEETPKQNLLHAAIRTELRFNTHVNHPLHAEKMHLPRLQFGVIDTESEAATAHRQFHVLRRDVCLSTYMRSKAAGIHWYNVVTPGSVKAAVNAASTEDESPLPCSYYTARGIPQLLEKLPWEKQAREDPYARYLPREMESVAREEVMCHACVGFRMCSPIAATIGTASCLSMNSARRSAEVECAQSERVAFAARREAGTRAFEHLTDAKCEAVLLSVAGVPLPVAVEKLAAHLQLSMNISHAAARNAVWCASEVAVAASAVRHITCGGRSSASTFPSEELISKSLARQLVAFRNFLSTSLPFFATDCPDAPSFIRNIAYMHDNVRISDSEISYTPRVIADPLEAVTMLTTRGGGDSLSMKYRLRETPYCNIAAPDHVDCTARLPFAFMSLLRSSTIQNMLNYNAMNLPDIRFYSSSERGRGLGVSTALVTSFFTSVFTEHRVFKALPAEDSVDGEPVYTLYDKEDDAYGECPGCTKFVSLMGGGKAAGAKQTCNLFRSPAFARCFGFMLRYTLMCEDTLPYRLDERVLRILMRQPTEETKSSRIYDNLSIASKDVVSMLMSKPDSALATYEVEFNDGCEGSTAVEHSIKLERATKFQYLGQTVSKSSIGGAKFIEWLKLCAKAMHFPLLTMLINSACNNSVTAFAGVLCGPVKLPTRGALLASMRYSCKYECGDKVKLIGLAAFAGNTPTDIVSLTTRVLTEVLRQLFNYKTTTPCEARCKDHIAKNSRSLQKLIENSQDVIGEASSSMAAALVHHLLADMNVVLLARKLPDQLIFHILEELCTYLLAVTTMRTTAYWVRWVCEQKPAVLSRFVFMATGKRVLPGKNELDELSVNALLEKTEKLNRTIDLNHRLADRASIITSYLGDFIKPRADTEEQRSSMLNMYFMHTMGPFDQIPVFSDRRSEAMAADMFTAEEREMFGASNGGVPYLSASVSALVNWNSICGRRPVFGTCSRNISLFAYKSYAHFDQCMLNALEAGENFSMD